MFSNMFFLKIFINIFIHCLQIELTIHGNIFFVRNKWKRCCKHKDFITLKRLPNCTSNYMHFKFY
jgi:hypothetical protein